MLKRKFLIGLKFAIFSRALFKRKMSISHYDRFHTTQCLTSKEMKCESQIVKILKLIQVALNSNFDFVSRIQIYSQKIGTTLRTHFQYLSFESNSNHFRTFVKKKKICL